MVVNPYLTQELLRADILGLLAVFLLVISVGPSEFFMDNFGPENKTLNYFMKELNINHIFFIFTLISSIL